ncbi:hypothetical protein DA2_3104 [Desulfovibrio sp. A2]|nr:hypothetical protein DA2_3104 [Desulfovibrio sp. A2]
MRYLLIAPSPTISDIKQWLFWLPKFYILIMGNIISSNLTTYFFMIKKVYHISDMNTH